MSPASASALTGWRFAGELRSSQAEVLAAVDVDAGAPLHIVAPPGAGKTLLGLLLACRRGRRAVVFSPTTTIRRQWVEAARGLAPDPTAVSDDPARPADLTALTYQAVSVLDTANPFGALARRRWLDELEADARTPEAAEEWLDALAQTHPAAYGRGIRSRSRTIRRALAREDADVLAAALHPNARALIEALVAHGVETIVLDECHHLLDHWALVVAALVSRVRAAGGAPLVIGLTATLPSPDDADEYDNYVALLGDVDHEVPVPAVVREGNLAPYLDLVRFVEPTPPELQFLASHAEALRVAVETSFAVGIGRDYLLAVLQPAPPSPDAADPLAPPPVDVADDVDTRLSAAFAADFAAAEAAAAMLTVAVPDHPLVQRLPEVARRPPTLDETLRLLGRFALERLLPDPHARDRWERLRGLAADFGYALTDRGIRRTRDPIDTVLASSLAKDHAACDVLRLEHAALGADRLRALVVTDFTTHANRHGGLLAEGGATRTFATIVRDAATSALRPLLVTATCTRIATRDAEVLLPALRAHLGDDVRAEPLASDPQVAELRGGGAHAAARAASALLREGAIQVVVGTRGLFGEGWDCPAVNTLVDLTAVATAAATQQLRGRTLRLDPAWPEKVAHNWTVTALIPPDLPLPAQPDAARLRRKHERLWGLDADGGDDIVRGLGVALDAARREGLRAIEQKHASAGMDAVNAPPPERAATRERWCVGSPFLDREEIAALVRPRRRRAVFRGSARAARSLGIAAVVALAAPMSVATAALALGARAAPVLLVLAAAAGLSVGMPLARAWNRVRRHIADVPGTYARVARVVWESLGAAGHVDASRAAPTLREIRGPDGTTSVEIAVPNAGDADQRLFAAALGELLGPVRTPRFLLEIDRAARGLPVQLVLERASARQTRDLLPVPALLGRRRGDAEAFAARWERVVGPAVLRTTASTEGIDLLARARRAGAHDAEADAITRWR